MMEKLLLANGFEVEERNVVWKAVEEFKNKRADFADCLIGIKNQLSGCQTTFSFDPNAISLILFEKVKH